MSVGNAVLGAVIVIACLSAIEARVSAREHDDSTSQAPLSKVADVRLPGPAVRFD